jgi:site-specific DNA-methyltransferase (adenine-specific)
VKPYYHDEAAGITIYCGDSRGFVLSERPALVLTDPPYGIKFKLNKGNARRPKHHRRAHLPAVVGDEMPFDPAHLLDFDRLILWGANYFADRLPPSPSWLVWDKRDGINSNDQADLEMAWTNLGGPARIYRHVWSGVIRASENGETHTHPTQKPVALMRWCLQRARLAPGALVYDPYMGSGPVAQACKELGYRYVGVELVEAYCAAAARRLAQEVMAL